VTKPEGVAGGRVRDERDARFFAWDVPGDAHIVALVHEVEDSERSATVADAIATSVARRREHTLLLSAEPGPSPLDELLGATGSKGLPAALEGRARLTDVAVQRVDRPFVYLPAGPDAGAMRSLLDDEVLASFVDRVRERGGTLFIVLSEETLRHDRVRALIDGYVALGDVDVPESAAGLVQFGRVRFENGDGADPHTSNGSPAVAGLPDLPPLPESPDVSSPGESVVEEPVAVEAAARGHPPPAAPVGEADVDNPGQVEDSPEIWQRHRGRPPFPTRKAVIGLGGVLGVAAIWWLITVGFGEGADTPVTGIATAARGAVPSTPVTPPPAISFDAPAGRAAFDAAPELGHSVMIASFAAAADADDRLRRLRSADAGFYFVSPTPVRGLVYHRVFAGALTGRGAAQTLMDALVASGVKGEAGAWHLRPAALAFDLGVYPDRAAADRRIDELAANAVPAYALTATGEAGQVWRVYGGAYVDDNESVPMAELLSEAGESAELITRRGTIP